MGWGLASGFCSTGRRHNHQRALVLEWVREHGPRLAIEAAQHQSVIIVGLLANTCTETTARYAQELGYHVTLVRDATAAVSKEMMHAAHELNGPTYAHAILNTSELIAALPSA
jgi:nicotinamidase-related amidase